MEGHQTVARADLTEEGQKSVAGYEELRVRRSVETETEADRDRLAHLMRADRYDCTVWRCREREGRLAAVRWRERIGRTVAPGRVELPCTSHASPTPSPLKSAWSGFARPGSCRSDRRRRRRRRRGCCCRTRHRARRIAVTLPRVRRVGTIVLLVTEAVAVGVDIAEAATGIADVAERIEVCVRLIGVECHRTVVRQVTARASPSLSAGPWTDAGVAGVAERVEVAVRLRQGWEPTGRVGARHSDHRRRDPLSPGPTQASHASPKPSKSLSTWLRLATARTVVERVRSNSSPSGSSASLHASPAPSPSGTRYLPRSPRSCLRRRRCHRRPRLPNRRRHTDRTHFRFRRRQNPPARDSRCRDSCRRGRHVRPHRHRLSACRLSITSPDRLHRRRRRRPRDRC